MAKLSKYLVAGFLLALIAVAGLTTIGGLLSTKQGLVRSEKNLIHGDDLFLFHPILKNYQTRRLLASRETSEF